MTNIEWGAEIKVDGVRPVWLGEDCGPVQITASGDYWVDASNPPRVWHWHGIKAIRLPRTHWAYLPLSRGFTPWAGGDEAPGDWDGGKLMIRNGDICSGRGAIWKHILGNSDIIGYRRRGEVSDDASMHAKPDYELEADGWKYRSGHRLHTSDCATSRAPAERPGPCDCGGVDKADACPEHLRGVNRGGPLSDPDTVTIKRMTEAEALEPWGHNLLHGRMHLGILKRMGLIRFEPTLAEVIAAKTGDPVEVVERVMAAMKEVG